MCGSEVHPENRNNNMSKYTPVTHVIFDMDGLLLGEYLSELILIAQMNVKNVFCTSLCSHKKHYTIVQSNYVVNFGFQTQKRCTCPALPKY